MSGTDSQNFSPALPRICRPAPAQFEDGDADSEEYDEEEEDQEEAQPEEEFEEEFEEDEEEEDEEEDAAPAPKAQPGATGAGHGRGFPTVFWWSLGPARAPPAAAASRQACPDPRSLPRALRVGLSRRD